MAMRSICAGIGVALVVMAVVLGLMAIGSPIDQRGLRLDERRVSALQATANSIEEYSRVHGRLPQTLTDLSRDPRFVTNTTDPETGRPYAYRPLSDRAYQLCADFARESRGLYDSGRWAHPAGSHCFDLDLQDRGK